MKHKVVCKNLKELFYLLERYNANRFFVNNGCWYGRVEEAYGTKAIIHCYSDKRMTNRINKIKVDFNDTIEHILNVEIEENDNEFTEQEIKAKAFDIIQDNVDLTLRQGKIVVEEENINDVGYYLEIRCAYEVITTDLSKNEYKNLKKAGVKEG